MSRIKALGYVGCQVSDLGAWDRFLGKVFDLGAFDEPEPGVHRYRLGGRDQWVALEQGGRDGLLHVGWEACSREALASLAADLETRGVSVERAGDGLCRRRGAAELIRLTGPDGVATEIYCPAADAAAAAPAAGPRLGHVVLAAGDRRATVEWYGAALGFQVSDHIFWDGVEASFLRCNPRHHSIALTNPVGDMRGGDLGHFMLEVDSIDMVGTAYDRARSLGVPIAFTFGRHSNDGAISFYAYSPSGWLVEYGYGGRLIDDPTWRPKLYDAPSIWGHEPQPPPGGDGTSQRY
ncbi:MAG: VOC family protein [Steroidobacteraceae bacterium]|nr:VOC family protein [Steroidobacteraceae bacterium]